MAGPDLLRVEVMSVIRRHLLAGGLSLVQAAAAIEDLHALPLRLYPTAPLLTRVWDLRDNLTTYDGCYVALAEMLDVPFLTADRRLASAPGVRCAVELV